MATKRRNFHEANMKHKFHAHIYYAIYKIDSKGRWHISFLFFFLLVYINKCRYKLLRPISFFFFSEEVDAKSSSVWKKLELKRIA